MRVSAVTVLSLILGTACIEPVDDTGSVVIPEDPPASAETVATAFASASGAMVGLGAPLADEATTVEAEHTDAGGELNNADTQTQVEGASTETGGEAWVTDPDCVTFDWTELVATVTFDSCELAATGDPLDGAVGLGIAFFPTRLTMNFDALTIGASDFDGDVWLRVVQTSPGGDAGGGQPAEYAVTLGADLDFSGEDGATTVGLDELELEFENGGLTIDGGGSVLTASVNTAVDATGVAFDEGVCLPTAGSLDYTDAGGFDVTVGFLPNTPVDGVVSVTWGPFTQEMALLPPCAP